ncbi:MAG: hypothetical protein AAGC55_00055 [Myxococcota bacterium]
MAFVGENIYSAEGYWGNNLINDKKNETVFTRLLTNPLSSWSTEDKQFVFAIYCLLLSGGPYRLEGMNWMQLDPITVEHYITQKAKHYSSLVIDDLPEDFLGMSIPEKAEAVKVLGA